VKLAGIQRIGLFVLKPKKKGKVHEPCPVCFRPMDLGFWIGGAGRGRFKLSLVEYPGDSPGHGYAMVIQQVGNPSTYTSSGRRRSPSAAARSLVSVLRGQVKQIERQQKRYELMIKLLEAKPRRAAP
jgi:hypothetical protein